MASISTVTRRRKRVRKIRVLCAMVKALLDVVNLWFLSVCLYSAIKSRKLKSSLEKENERLNYLFRLIKENDSACISQLRMDRRTFFRLCEMIRDVGGLKGTRNMMLEEIVAMFVSILAHHKKNRTLATNFLRSGETVSRHFNRCLLAMLKLHPLLLKKPEPTTEACTDDRWKYFKRHKDARGTWDLKFPYLDALELAFERDRATGQAAEGFDDAVQILEAESHPFSEVGEEYEEENLNGGPTNGDSSSQRLKRPAPPTKMEPKKIEPKEKKRFGGTSLEETLENVNSNLVKCFDGIAVNFTSMAATMVNEDKREQETFAHKSSIIAELQRLGISDGDIFKAGVILRGDESKLDVFYQFPDEMKKKYVYSLLYPNGF